jgi:hypothetical protein
MKAKLFGMRKKGQKEESRQEVRGSLIAHGKF